MSFLRTRLPLLLAVASPIAVFLASPHARLLADIGSWGS
jgi:hypothetical protein